MNFINIIICLFFCVQPKFINCESNVPQNLWNQNVVIKNSYGLEYLYADDRIPETSGLWELGPTNYHRRRILTKTDKSFVPAAGEWFLSTEDNGRTFTLKNKKYNEYLYSPNTNQYTKPPLFGYNTEKTARLSKGPYYKEKGPDDDWQFTDRYVFTWHAKEKVSTGYWYIIPIPGKNENEFWIKNAAYNEYLYLADEFNAENRNVYTALNRSDIAELLESHWKIELKPSKSNPSNVPKEFWNKTVTLSNAYRGEYLFAKNVIPQTFKGLLWDTTYYHRRRILTKKFNKRISGADEWFLSTDDEGESFTFKNKQYDEYLYAANTDLFTKPTFIAVHDNTSIKYDWHDRDRFVFTWHEKVKITQGYWYIIPVKGSDNEFLIRNKVHNEYLYVGDDYKSDYRNVYTSLKGSLMANYPESYWKIELANCWDSQQFSCSKNSI